MARLPAGTVTCTARKCSVRTDALVKHGHFAKIKNLGELFLCKDCDLWHRQEGGHRPQPRQTTGSVVIPLRRRCRSRRTCTNVTASPVVAMAL